MIADRKSTGAAKLSLAFAVALAGLPRQACSSETAAAEATPTVRESQLKLGFLYNFYRYVEWPEGTFPAADSPVIIGVLGDHPMVAELRAGLKDKTIDKRPFVVKQFADATAIGACHILFVPRADVAHYKEVLKATATTPALTVGEDVELCKAGGIISILIEQQKPSLSINPGAAATARLTISAKLLKISKICTTEASR